MKVFFISFMVLFASCAGVKSEYDQEIEDWKKERVENLTSAISWSSLSGLVWLQEGDNKVGNTDSADIILNKSSQENIGLIQNQSDGVYFISGEKGKTSIDKDLISKVKLIPDTQEGNQKLNHEQYYFTLIERNEKKGIRIWDTLNPSRDLYKELDYFPIDPRMRVKAEYKSYESPQKSILKNVLGMDVEQEVEGYLEFQIQGKSYSLQPLDGGPDDFFLIFADQTTGGDTYGGGRYLYCPRPDENGITYIDFNKGYSPPCGFTEYATCLLPSKENTLDLEIKAGEKYDFVH